MLFSNLVITLGFAAVLAAGVTLTVEASISLKALRLSVQCTNYLSYLSQHSFMTLASNIIYLPYTSVMILYKPGIKPSKWNYFSKNNNKKASRETMY